MNEEDPERHLFIGKNPLNQIVQSIQVALSNKNLLKVKEKKKKKIVIYKTNILFYENWKFIKSIHLFRSSFFLTVEWIDTFVAAAIAKLCAAGLTYPHEVKLLIFFK